MFILCLSILVASLLGSLHCVGMCGAFVAIAVQSGGTPEQRSRQWPLHACYHAGRLVTYLLLGIAAGAVGRLADLSAALAGIKPVAAALAGAVMVVFGGVALLRLWGVRIAPLRPPGILGRSIAAVHRRAMNQPPWRRAGLIGLFTTLLPCGWLYAFAAAAAGTASPWRGALAMAAFWLGTLPALVALGAGLRATLGNFGGRLPALTSLLLVAVGLYTLLNRSLLDPAAIAARVHSPGSAEPACCQNK
jgi:uncharacterized protein